MKEKFTTVNYKQFIAIEIILILILLIISCSNLSNRKETRTVEIIAGKDSTFNIYQNVSGSPSTLLLDISEDIDNNDSFLIVSFEDSGNISNRNIRQSIKIKEGRTHHGTDLFEPHFVLYYKNGKAKKGKIFVKIKIY